MNKFPPWLRRSLTASEDFFKTKKLLKEFKLETVCEQAKCPNRFYCFEKKRATFLALGKYCTRKCAFCDISHSKTPLPPDKTEGQQIALLSKKLQLKHIVITMVTRDDLEDQGASHIAEIIKQVREINPQSTIEVLTSDFSENKQLLDIIIKAKPHIFNHNIETVRSISPKIRDKAKYESSLNVLKYVKTQNPKIYTKSGFMLGLGEKDPEIKQAISDLKKAGCDIITIGQYLQASDKCLKVTDFIPPEKFREYEKYGYELGVKVMHCAPFVRSSFNAENILK